MDSASGAASAGRWQRLTAIGSAGAIVGVASVAVNGLAYLVPVLAARLLPADQLGALAALVGIGAIAAVAGPGLQLASAVRWARQGAVPRAGRVALATAAVTSGVLLLATPALAAALDLPPIQLVLLAVLTFPVVLAGLWLGELQGRQRFGRLAVGMAVLGGARYGGLVIALAGGLGVTAALAVGAGTAWLAIPVLRRLADPAGTGSADPVRAQSADTVRAEGAHTVRAESADTVRVEGAGVAVAGALAGRDVVRAGTATFAMMAISYADLILARHALPAAQAGAYSVGSVLTKGALWAPAVVTVLALPRLARGSRRAMRTALGSVAAIGLALVVAAALFGGLAMRVAGGVSYTHLGRDAAGFAAIGALYALVFVFVNAEIAAGSRFPAAPLWLALGGIVAAVELRPVADVAGMLLIAVCTAAATTVAMAVGYAARRRHRAATRTPAAPMTTPSASR
jgi:O-antigen/teichoic acid export membrane protein